MSWFDTHCHVYLGDQPADEQVARARAAGVGEMVIVGVDLETSLTAIEIAAEDDGLYASVGIHPNDCGGFDDGDSERLEELVAHPKVVAIGETGIDLYRDRVDFETQERAFRAQIELAKQNEKALIVHTRNAHAETKEVLESAGPPPRFVMHCFSGTVDDGDDYLALGATISVAGPVTFKNAPELRDAVTRLPLESLVVETDSPFLSPHPFRGQANEPGRVVLVGEAIAALKAVPPDEVASATTANARSLFGIS